MTRSNLVKNASALALTALLAAGALGLAGCGETQDNTVSSATPAASDTQASTDAQAASAGTDAAADQAGASDEQDNCYGDDLPVINTEA